MISAVGWYQTNTSLQSTTHLMERAQANEKAAESASRAASANLAEESSRRRAAEANAERAEESASFFRSCIAEMGGQGMSLLQAATTFSAYAGMMQDGAPFLEAVFDRDALLVQVADHYYDAITAAWDSNYSAANKHIDKGNAAAKNASKKLDIVLAEMKKAQDGDIPDASTIENMADTYGRCYIDTGIREAAAAP